MPIYNNNNDSELKSSTSKAIKGTKIAVKGSKKAYTAIKSLKGIQRGKTILQTLYLAIKGKMAILIIMAILPFICIMAVGSSLLGMLDWNQSTVEDHIVQESSINWIQETHRSYDEVINFLNEEYEENFFVIDFRQMNSIYDNVITAEEEDKDNALNTIERVKVKLEYLPILDELKALITSYVTSVNSVISLYDKEITEGNFDKYYEARDNKVYDELYKNPNVESTYSVTDSPLTEDSEITKIYESEVEATNTDDKISAKPKDYDGLENSVKYTDEVKDIAKNEEDPGLSPQSDSFKKDIKNHIGENGLFYVPESTYWVHDSYELEPYEEEIWVEYTPEPEDPSNPAPPTNPNNGVDTGYMAVYTINEKQINIKIPVLYDISKYKEDELNNIKDYLIEFDNEVSTSEEADQKLHDMISGYYESAMQYWGYEMDDAIRQPYLETFGIYNTMMGVPTDRLMGVEGFDGDIGDAGYITDANFKGWEHYRLGTTYSGLYSNYYKFGSQEAREIWAHVHKEISGIAFQCTTFVRSIFKDYYGFDYGAAGDGKHVADYIIQNFPDMFERGSSPAPGAVFSVNNGKYGHVGFVHEVNGNMITFSDGNVMEGGVRVMLTVPLSDFFARWPNAYFAIPKQGFENNPVNPDENSENNVVLAVGDSITEGYTDSNYPSKLEAKLGGNYKVKNFGNSGTCVNDNGYEPYRSSSTYRNSLTENNVGKIIIMFGTNDSTVDSWVNKQTFKSNYASLVDDYATRYPESEIYLCTIANAFAKGEGLAIEYKIDLSKYGDINAAIREVASEKGLTVIDVYGLTQNQSQWFLSGGYDNDGVHPNGSGQDAIANLIYNNIK